MAPMREEGCTLSGMSSSCAAGSQLAVLRIVCPPGTTSAVSGPPGSCSGCVAWYCGTCRAHSHSADCRGGKAPSAGANHRGLTYCRPRRRPTCCRAGTGGRLGAGRPSLQETACIAAALSLRLGAVTRASLGPLAAWGPKSRSSPGVWPGPRGRGHRRPPPCHWGSWGSCQWPSREA